MVAELGNCIASDGTDDGIGTNDEFGTEDRDD